MRVGEGVQIREKGRIKRKRDIKNIFRQYPGYLHIINFCASIQSIFLEILEPSRQQLFFENAFTDGVNF